MSEIRGELLTRKEVAELLGVSDSTVHRWARDGKLPRHVTWPSGQRRWRRSDIDKLVRRIAEGEGPEST
ncbi:MAG: helix-turn-helix domain-containing protein [Terriglobales bacterium]